MPTDSPMTSEERARRREDPVDKLEALFDAVRAARAEFVAAQCVAMGLRKARCLAIEDNGRHGWHLFESPEASLALTKLDEQEVAAWVAAGLAGDKLLAAEKAVRDG